MAGWHTLGMSRRDYHNKMLHKKMGDQQLMNKCVKNAHHKQFNLCQADVTITFYLDMSAMQSSLCFWNKTLLQLYLWSHYHCTRSKFCFDNHLHFLSVIINMIQVWSLLTGVTLGTRVTCLLLGLLSPTDWLTHNTSLLELSLLAGPSLHVTLICCAIYRQSAHILYYTEYTGSLLSQYKIYLLFVRDSNITFLQS